MLSFMKTLFTLFLLAFVAPAIAQSPPTEFVTQILEPTGGKIERPKDWFYAEGHGGPSFVWTLSREDSGGNRPYTTGVRIQVLGKVKSGTGKTPKDFILGFIAEKRKSALVLSTCEEQKMEMFTRICLETEEGPHRILYSFFWGSDGMDLVVISVAGTTKELWSTFAPTFERMSRFEFIDMKRFPQ